jgi:hypothetical protein
MGKYATLQFLSREFRAEIDDPDDYVTFMSRAKAMGEGYHPVGEPKVEWFELTQYDIDMELAAMRLAGIERPVTPWRPHDWRVRVIFQVAEDAELQPGELK